MCHNRWELKKKKEKCVPNLCKGEALVGKKCSLKLEKQMRKGKSHQKVRTCEKNIGTNVPIFQTGRKFLHFKQGLNNGLFLIIPLKQGDKACRHRAQRLVNSNEASNIAYRCARVLGILPYVVFALGRPTRATMLSRTSNKGYYIVWSLETKHALKDYPTTWINRIKIKAHAAWQQGRSKGCGYSCCAVAVGTAAVKCPQIGKNLKQTCGCGPFTPASTQALHEGCTSDRIGGQLLCDLAGDFRRRSPTALILFRFGRFIIIVSECVLVGCSR